MLVFTLQPYLKRESNPVHAFVSCNSHTCLVLHPSCHSVLTSLIHPAFSQAVVFSKSYCPYCKNTKRLFADMKLPFTVVELDQLPESEREGEEGAGGTSLQAALLLKTGQRTVPNVFVSGHHVGGNDDTVAAAQSGLLMELWEMEY